MTTVNRSYKEVSLLKSLFEATKLLSSLDRRKLVIVSLITFLINLLDVFAVALAGAVGALAISGFQNKSSGTRVTTLLEKLNLMDVDLRTQILFISGIACLLLLVKSAAAFFFTRKIFIFMSRNASRVSRQLLQQIMLQDLSFLHRRSVQENLYATTSGVTSLIVGLLGSAIIIVTDISLFLFLFVGMLIVDPWTAIVFLLLFLVLGMIMQLVMGNKATQMGKIYGRLNVAGNQKTSDLLTTFREVKLRHNAEYFIDAIDRNRENLVQSLATMRTLPLVSKYIFEIAVLILGVVVTLFQFSFNEPSRAAGNLVFFIAASSRITPAVLRVQQNLLSMKNAMGASQKTRKLISDIKNIESDTEYIKVGVGDSTPELKSKVILENVYFKYDDQKSWAVENINLELSENSSLGIVGRTGCGKSTLVDLMLGLLEPSRGNVLIYGVEAAVAATLSPGKIAYVPQHVYTHNATILDNILLGESRENVDFDWLHEVLEITQLRELVEVLPGGLEYLIHDRGVSLSGGQRQRLGIARAMLTKPRLLVLDESTSALDAKSESLIMQSLDVMKVYTSIVIVAHRLSTVRNADKLIYLEHGSIREEGNFEELAKKVPDFHEQAKLMGILGR